MASETKKTTEKPEKVDDKKKALALVLEKLDKTYGKGTVMKLGDSSIDSSIELSRVK